MAIQDKRTYDKGLLSSWSPPGPFDLNNEADLGLIDLYILFTMDQILNQKILTHILLVLF